jgi:hypothetical protein
MKKRRYHDADIPYLLVLQTYLIRSYCMDADMIILRGKPWMRSPKENPPTGRL